LQFQFRTECHHTHRIFCLKIHFRARDAPLFGSFSVTPSQKLGVAWPLCSRSSCFPDRYRRYRRFRIPFPSVPASIRVRKDDAVTERSESCGGDAGSADFQRPTDRGSNLGSDANCQRASGGRISPTSPSGSGPVRQWRCRRIHEFRRRWPNHLAATASAASHPDGRRTNPDLPTHAGATRRNSHRTTTVTATTANSRRPANNSSRGGTNHSVAGVVSRGGNFRLHKRRGGGKCQRRHDGSPKQLDKQHRLISSKIANCRCGGGGRVD